MTMKTDSVDVDWFLWFTQGSEHGVVKTGPIIKEKPLSLGRKLFDDSLFILKCFI